MYVLVEFVESVTLTKSAAKVGKVVDANGFELPKDVGNGLVEHLALGPTLLVAASLAMREKYKT